MALAFWSRVAAPSTSYEPRSSAQSALYQIVQDHFETFRAQAASLRDGEGLPRFVEQEFRDFLQCGWLVGGFARFHCGDCGLDRLVPFSCKARAICPNCGSRRMAERAAHLLDHVFPDVPVRQWVLSLPYRLPRGTANTSYRLSYDGIRRFRLPMDDSPAAAPSVPKSRLPQRSTRSTRRPQSHL